MALNIAPGDEIGHRKAPLIPVANLKMNNGGMVWKEYQVRLPEGFVADDLKEPSAWRQIQGAKGLVKHDRLYLVAFDESWAAEAIVGYADGEKVVLCKPRLTTFPERFDKLFETELFRIEWVGVGFCVIRKTDNTRMTQPVSSAAIAERELSALHPRGDK